MKDNDTIHELIQQARNTRHLVDDVVYAYYGMKTDELLRLALSGKEDNTPPKGTSDGEG